MEIKVLHQVMEWNEDVSAAVRETLRAHKVCLVNVMGSPGAGKTSLITEMIRRLRGSFSIGVIEGTSRARSTPKRLRLCRFRPCSSIPTAPATLRR